MRIRAITIGQKIPFLHKNETLESFMEEKLENFKNFNNALIEKFEDINLIVETKRLCSQPLFSYDEQRIYTKNLDNTLGKIDTQFGIIQRIIKNHNIDYFACCSMRAEYLKDFSVFERLLLYQFPVFLKKFTNFFTSLPVASTDEGINLAALRAGAHVIKELSSPEPLNNLQFCVSANVPPNTPFFPAAYHMSEDASFSLALEMADEVSRAFRSAKNLVDAKNNLRNKFGKIYSVLLEISEKVGKEYNINFSGMDFSPAPFPKLTRSIGYAVEKLNLDHFGSYGSLLAIGLIKKCIPKKEKVIGFSGFMQPVLEDYIIAKRVAEGKVSLDRLLLNSSICGTGLDCIPLPGDITEKELFYILLDLCTISVMLNKPLTARLMPIPGKKAGDDIDFNFEYFSPTKVMDFQRLPDDTKEGLYHSKEKFFHFF